MNERIKELAEQAGYESDMFGIGHWDMPEFKKFAELIVLECAKVCYNPDNEIYQTRIPVLYEANKRIKEHFGINDDN